MERETGVITTYLDWNLSFGCSNRCGYSLDKDKGRHIEGADITGYTCMEGDILAYNFNGKIAEGDFLEFSNVGAYSIMLKPPFIKEQAIILSKNNNNYNIIKNKETIEDIFSTYIY